MRAFSKLLVVGGLLISGVTAAGPVEDFRGAADKDGCDSIPYSNLRGTCAAKLTEVESWCKSSTRPISCKGLDPRGLTQQLDVAKKRLDELRKQRDELAANAAYAKDEEERLAVEAKLKETEGQIAELEKRIVDTEKKLVEEQTAVADRVFNGERCVVFREDVARAFLDAKASVKAERDPDLKPFIERLVAKWERDEPVHTESVKTFKTTLEVCRAMR